jgi:hypothetical protein
MGHAGLESEIFCTEDQLLIHRPPYPHTIKFKIIQKYTFMMRVYIFGYTIFKKYAVTVFVMGLNETSFRNL